MGALVPKHTLVSLDAVLVTGVVVKLVQRAVGIGPAGFGGRFGVVGPVPFGLEPDGREPPGVGVGCEGEGR